MNQLHLITNPDLITSLMFNRDGTITVTTPNTHTKAHISDLTRTDWLIINHQLKKNANTTLGD